MCGPGSRLNSGVSHDEVCLSKRLKWNYQKILSNITFGHLKYVNVYVRGRKNVRQCKGSGEWYDVVILVILQKARLNHARIESQTFVSFSKAFLNHALLWSCELAHFYRSERQSLLSKFMFSSEAWRMWNQYVNSSELTHFFEQSDIFAVYQQKAPLNCATI